MKNHSSPEQNSRQPTNQPTNQPTTPCFLKPASCEKKIPMHQAIGFLDRHFVHIPNVETWSQLMGYLNRQDFWRKFDVCFNQAPQTIYIRKKIQILVDYIRGNPDCTSKEAALVIHHKNGNELNQFVTTKLECTFTDLKEKIRDKNELNPIFVTKYGDIL